MICSLRGKIERIGKNFVELEVAGVGYLVWCGDRTLRQVREGEEVKMFTYMAVSENDQSLYGFLAREEVDCFKMFLGVSGVGPKSASALMGSLTVEEVIRAVSEADTKVFEKVRGIGKKASQKIIIELKSKIGGMKELDLNEEDWQGDEVYLSLKQLGFAKGEIDRVMKGIPEEVVVMEERLSWCLKNLG